MKLTSQLISELAQIMLEEYNFELSFEEAEEMADSLVEVFAILSRAPKGGE